MSALHVKVGFIADVTETQKKAAYRKKGVYRYAACLYRLRT